jgi:hypothetical protein
MSIETKLFKMKFNTSIYLFLIYIEQCSHRSATELLDESKAFFVKSQEVLHNRQTLLNNRTSNEQQRLKPSFRIAYVYSDIIK